MNIIRADKIKEVTEELLLECKEEPNMQAIFNAVPYNLIKAFAIHFFAAGAEFAIDGK